MKVAHPRCLAEALGALESIPEAQLLAGGTNFMVGVKFGHPRPEGIVGLRRVNELRGYEVLAGELVLRAGLTYREMEHEGELIQAAPVHAEAARTIG